MGKRLGQHFLTERRYLHEIAAALELESGDTVIEIGAGHGELTEELLKTPMARVIAIEKDPELASSSELHALNKNYGERVEILEGDALTTLPKLTGDQAFNGQNYKITGNIPYYFTGHLLRIVGELAYKPTRALFTVQEEVAERITAQPPKMNLLAASVQFWAEASIVGRIPRKAFSPPPKVDSAIVGLRTKSYESRIAENYYRLIKVLFKQPRKTILNNLAHTAAERRTVATALHAAGINAADRPQNLSLKDILAISALRYTEEQ